METMNYAGSETGGLTWQDLEAGIASRSAVLSGEAQPQLTG
jgi:hypothetical protein